MAFGSILGVLDRLSARSILRGISGSWLGLLASIALIAICIIIYIAPVLDFKAGNYYESMFSKIVPYNLTYYSGSDIKMAIVFRNKTDQSYANHSLLKDTFRDKVFYTRPLSYITGEMDLLPCSP